jgi:transcriptional regulator with XRE-family HTH domain
MSEKEVPVSERIKILFQHFGDGNLSAFARELGVSAQAIRDLMKGEKGGPSWPVLQNILRAFPSISTDWLVLGQGQMLRDNILAVDLTQPHQYVTHEQLKKETEQSIESVVKLFDAYKHDLSEKAQLEQVYRIGDVHASKKLAERLSITAEEARDLVLDGRIRSTYIGKDNDRSRRNGISYLITEAAVREFLGEV